MWLFLVETYLFVLVAFALGVGVGLVGVRVLVRRQAPPRADSPDAARAAPVAPAPAGTGGEA